MSKENFCSLLLGSAKKKGGAALLLPGETSVSVIFSAPVCWKDQPGQEGRR
jgi:hypothetical protein